MKRDVLEHDRVEAWKTKSPRHWWAFVLLNEEDELRDRVLAAVLGGRGDDEAIDGLIRFAEALEAHRRASKAGTVKVPPAVGERRSFAITVSRMTRMLNQAGPFFRVDFACPDGWGGHFDTTNPDVVETVSRLRNRAKPLTVVGEVSRRPYEFYIELQDSVRIV